MIAAVESIIRVFVAPVEPAALPGTNFISPSETNFNSEILLPLLFKAWIVIVLVEAALAVIVKLVVSVLSIERVVLSIVAPAVLTSKVVVVVPNVTVLVPPVAILIAWFTASLPILITPPLLLIPIVPDASRSTLVIPLVVTAPEPLNWINPVSSPNLEIPPPCKVKAPDGVMSALAKLVSLRAPPSRVKVAVPSVMSTWLSLSIEILPSPLPLLRDFMSKVFADALLAVIVKLVVSVLSIERVEPSIVIPAPSISNVVVLAPIVIVLAVASVPILILPAALVVPIPIVPVVSAVIALPSIVITAAFWVIVSWSVALIAICASPLPPLVAAIVITLAPSALAVIVRLVVSVLSMERAVLSIVVVAASISNVVFAPEPIVIVLAVVLVPNLIAPAAAFTPIWISPPAVSTVKLPVDCVQSILIPPEPACKLILPVFSVEEIKEPTSEILKCWVLPFFTSNNAFDALFPFPITDKAGWVSVKVVCSITPASAWRIPNLAPITESLVNKVVVDIIY